MKRLSDDTDTLLAQRLLCVSIDQQDRRHVVPTRSSMSNGREGQQNPARPNVDSLPGQRRRRCPGIEPEFDQPLLRAGTSMSAGRVCQQSWQTLPSGPAARYNIQKTQPPPDGASSRPRAPCVVKKTHLMCVFPHEVNYYTIIFYIIFTSENI